MRTLIPSPDTTIQVPSFDPATCGSQNVDLVRPTLNGKAIYVKAGATGGDGSEKKPFASVHEALESIKFLDKDNTRIVTVVLASGEYYLDAPITLDASYTAYASEINILCPDKEPAILAGWKKIPGWCPTTVNGVSAWEADLPQNLTPHQFFAKDGTRLSRPRFPESGYLVSTGVPGIENALCRENPWWISTDEGLTFPVGAIPALSHLDRINVIAPHYWVCDIFTVKSLDTEKGEMMFDNTASCAMMEPLGKGVRFYLDNVFETFGHPGEVYADPEAKKIYYIPKSEDTIENFFLYASDLEMLLSVNGYENAKLTFSNLSFVGSDWDGKGRAKEISQGAANLPGAIMLANTEQVRFLDCSIIHVGTWAASLRERCRNIVFDRCTLSDLGAGGIDIKGGGSGHLRDKDEACQNITVTNCTVSHFGRIYMDGVGLLVRFCRQSTFSHNDIFDGYYTGVSVGWHWGIDSETFQSVTGNNLISYNRICKIGQKEMADLGGIYTLGTQENSFYLNNLIYDIHGSSYGGWGIYPDEGSSNMVFRNNVVYDTKEQVFRVHYGQNIFADNNIFAFGELGAFDVGRKPEKSPGMTQQTIQFTRNLLICNNTSVYFREPGFYWMTDSSNLVWDYAGEPFCAKEQKLTAEQMQAGGLFKNVCIADPLFADPFGGDFTLSPDSPAFRIGFQAIDLSEVGPQ